MRERGLKLGDLCDDDADGDVAPHAGAWIETLWSALKSMFLIVAPHAGAWIETYAPHTRQQNQEVAPHAGAWIETEEGSNTAPIVMSLPMRERGLKHLN